MNTRPPLATPPLPHLDTPEEATFEKDLTRLINCYSKENGSDTPDFILALYIQGCLSVFNTTLQLREKWYGREIHQKVTEPSPCPTCNDRGWIESGLSGKESVICPDCKDVPVPFHHI